MTISRTLTLLAGGPVLSAAAAAVWSLPAAAQAPGSGAARMAALSGFGNDDWVALGVIVLCGALGAFASDLVADGGRLARWKKDEGGWSLGFLAKLVIGSVAAVIMLALNPAGEWWQLIGTALAAGVGGEAILLSIVAARRAEAAEKDRQQAEAHARNITALAQERLVTLKAAALGEDLSFDPVVTDASDPATDRVAKSADVFSFAEGGGRPAGSAASEKGGRTRMVALLADRFRAEVAAFTTGGGSIRERVRAILVSNLGHDDVDERPLGEIGGKDAGVRRLIARDIRRTWEKDNLNPPWTDGDVIEASTLRSLTDEIDRRGGV